MDERMLSIPSTSRALRAEEFVSRASEAWLRHGLGVRPRDVDVIKKEPRHKSTVLRLHGAGPDGKTVIAKRCPSAVARIECTVYRQILPRLPVVVLQLYGASDEQNGFTWLFLEDAGEVAWSPGSPAHRRLAADWLAGAHVAAKELVDVVELPFRDTDYYLQCLRSAEVVLRTALVNEAIDSDGQKLLRGIISDCVAFERQWREIEELWNRFPLTLTLPGFSKDNVRVGRGGSTILPFDFENAGWGVPAVDIARIDISRYRTRVAQVWPIRSADLRLLATLGAAVCSLKSIPGEESSLTGPWPEHSLQKLMYYAGDLAAGLRELG